MKYLINSQEHPTGKVKDSFIESNLKLEVVAITW